MGKAGSSHTDPEAFKDTWNAAFLAQVACVAARWRTRLASSHHRSCTPMVRSPIRVRWAPGGAFTPQVVNEAAGSEMSGGDPSEGGGTSAERRGTFTDLALCLAPGLDAAALSTLFNTAVVGLQARAAVPGNAMPGNAACSRRHREEYLLQLGSARCGGALRALAQGHLRLFSEASVPVVAHTTCASVAVY